ncbi:hypothetical protein COV05_01275 [Candidatus Uhrbacteria bacterium CG10_big_fil_rev_8_21_14_0_10_48_16]|uniref:Uncharacterized protein n=1 Tax=Candidatus Uhrbacteria bacterium CG10_big_fil_rev_8_21_14_0_10_48_16 TaxID=1975038 RepID=A0A2M8LHX2_9BACT|nr:MAG: hypothetical protein COV05_01275 [Candidatus Uhrbacteria bacterium CG10_big_fil_rev_8_21_14_0_10_48_16]
MDHNLLNGKTPLSNPVSRGFWKVGLLILASVLVFVLILGGGAFAWAQQYQNRIPPRTMIDGMDVSGLDPGAVQMNLQNRIDDILTNGIEVQVDEVIKTLSLITITDSDLFENVDFQLEETISSLMEKHSDNPFADTYAMVTSVFRPVSTTIPVTIQEDRVRSSVLSLFPDSEVLSQRATFDLSWNTEKDMWSIGIVDGTSGKEFQWDAFFTTLEDQLIALDTQTITLALIDQTPKDFSQDEEHELVSKAATALQSAPYLITYEDLSWELTGDDLITLLAPGEDGRLTLLDEPLALWIASIADEVNQSAQNARLTIEDGRVTDFVESLEGRMLNEEQLREDLISLISSIQEAPIPSIELVVEVSEPTITTGDVNDLGIDEILGTGTSSYRGSPANRRANIQNGVDLLNGRLIAPGETFSLIQALSPFTYDNGYLPELVIKGDKIEAELGGGLCQIGTTTFRAVMNSALEVTERRNHSLVVSYYNDPANGNPGTDATIYEPAPNFKFTNDTDHYVLFQAENLTETQELRFTMWGTSDGRHASYSPPIVSRWIPVGETQYIETTDLEPGVEQCQGSHTGADASFTYTVVRPDGEIEETLFESHYRPLPRICLIGVEETVEEEEVVEEDLTEEPTDESVEEVVESSETIE